MDLQINDEFVELSAEDSTRETREKCDKCR